MSILSAFGAATTMCIPGEAHFSLLDQIGQQPSYFCLRNDDWQFLAMDTGHFDSIPTRCPQT